MTTTLYDFPVSGHAHCVRLFLSLVGTLCDTAGATRMGHWLAGVSTLDQFEEMPISI